MVNGQTPDVDLPMRLRQALYHAGATLEILAEYLTKIELPEDVRNRTLKASGDLSLTILELRKYTTPKVAVEPGAPVAPEGPTNTPPAEPLADPANDRMEVKDNANSQDPGGANQAPQG